MRKDRLISIFLVLIMALSLVGCGGDVTGSVDDFDEPSVEAPIDEESFEEDSQEQAVAARASAADQKLVDVNSIPKYKGKPYVVINGGKPYFKKNEIRSESFEYYSPLDKLGRCQMTVASVGRDIMPTKDREGIGQVKPTGWETKRYDFVDGKYVYNRCHLIGFQLTGENANVCNLITGTRYLNNEGMLPFENQIADYVKSTGNHVMYRVTPIFKGQNLLAHGVLMEAVSVEDNGRGLKFNVYCYNVQPHVKINYKTGKTTAAPGYEEGKGNGNGNGSGNGNAQMNCLKGDVFVINTNTKKIHYKDCYSAKQTKAKNKKTFKGNCKYLIRKGYEPCKNCLNRAS